MPLPVPVLTSVAVEPGSSSASQNSAGGLYLKVGEGEPWAVAFQQRGDGACGDSIGDRRAEHRRWLGAASNVALWIAPATPDEAEIGDKGGC